MSQRFDSPLISPVNEHQRTRDSERAPLIVSANNSRNYQTNNHERKHNNKLNADRNNGLRKSEDETKQENTMSYHQATTSASSTQQRQDEQSRQYRISVLDQYNAYRSQFNRLSEAWKFRLAGCWFHDSMHFRKSYLLCEPSRIQAHNVLHKKMFRLFRKCILVIHLLLALFEWPSDNLAPVPVTELVEMFCCIIYAIELWLHCKIRGWNDCIHDPWFCVKGMHNIHVCLSVCVCAPFWYLFMVFV